MGSDPVFLGNEMGSDPVFDPVFSVFYHLTHEYEKEKGL